MLSRQKVTGLTGGEKVAGWEERLHQFIIELGKQDQIAWRRIVASGSRSLDVSPEEPFQWEKKADFVQDHIRGGPILHSQESKGL